MPLGTASPQLDGRLDGVFTMATLTAQFPPAVTPIGTIATTSDYGKVWNNGAAWVSTASSNINGTNPNMSLQTPLTAFAITIAAGITTLLLNPAGALATGAVTMPAAPYDGQEVTVASSQAVSALTVNANAGQTINGAPTAIAANASFRYKYNLSLTTWFRLQ
jgi:hypothetical protein